MNTTTRTGNLQLHLFSIKQVFLLTLLLLFSQQLIYAQAIETVKVKGFGKIQYQVGNQLEIDEGSIGQATSGDFLFVEDDPRYGFFAGQWQASKNSYFFEPVDNEFDDHIQSLIDGHTVRLYLESLGVKDRKKLFKSGPKGDFSNTGFDHIRITKINATGKWNPKKQILNYKFNVKFQVWLHIVPDADTDEAVAENEEPPISGVYTLKGSIDLSK